MQIRQPVHSEHARTLDTTGLATGKHTVYVRGRDAAGNLGAVSAIFLVIR